MPEAKTSKRKTALTGIGGAILGVATWLGGQHIVAPAQAQSTPPAGVATAEQVAKLDAKMDRFIDRVIEGERKQAVQAEQIRQLEGAQNASLRGHAR